MKPDRIESLDVLRGLALFGMIVVHFHIRSSEPGGIDDVVRTLTWRLVESKSHGIFALLFGAGFAIQLRRAEARGSSFTALYLRRMGVLALFGFAAHALFGFNVLLGYAVWGVPLLFIRRWSTRALIVTALISAVSIALYYLAYTMAVTVTQGGAALDAAFAARDAEAVAVRGALDASASRDSYTALVAARLRHMAWFYSQPFFFMPGATITLFIAGALLVRHRVFEQALAHRRLLLVMTTFGVVAWLVGNWLTPIVQFASLFGLLRDQWLTFTYVAVALFVLARFPGLMASLRPIANAGRMALTNYLLQIAVLDLLFSGYAVGLGQIRPIAGLAAAIGLFALEVAFSAVWFRHFRLGPAEWLWRSITYGRRQPMRLPAGVEQAAAPAISS